jgi:hypothetical protein
MADPIIYKTLIGVNRQEVTADYYYSLPVSGVNSVQNAINSANYEEVYIDCFTNEGNQQIYLPAISKFRRGFSPKIYVCNKGSNSVTIFGSVSETETNLINASPTWIVPSNATAYLHINNDLNWALWVTVITEG